MSVELTSNDVLCKHCFDCLESFFKNKPQPALPEPYNSSGIECPMFVTLNTITRRGLELRGCIGTLSPVPLSSMNDYVLKSAFEDRRFEPLHEEELRNLEISFSVLTNFEPTSGYLDWTVEQHGIRISFSADGRHYSATYLPGVASEQGWNKIQTLESLVRKAGYKGKRLDEEFFSRIEVVRYQSSKHSMNYDQYIASNKGG